MIPIKAKFAKEIGTRVSLRRYWGDGAHGQKHGYHNASIKLQDVIHPLILGNHEHIGGSVEDYPEDMWPKVCEECGEPVPPHAQRQVFNKRLYDTESGDLEIGSLWYAYWLPKNLYWDNKEDFHLLAMVPGGQHWNIDSRASNCGSPNDRLHRCWCRHGDPETGIVHVDKNGLTCNAGAGSIGTANWHGFLHNGMFHV